MTRYVLSCQGGGERGIVPCLALAKLEAQTGMLTRDWLIASHGMIAGTSTGALLTACVACGVPMTEALKVYTEQGPKIFSPQNQAERTMKMVVTGHQFDNKVANAVVRATLAKGQSANSELLINDSPVRVLIPATAYSGDPWYFVKDAVRNAKTTGKYKVADAAVASACATTFHAPWLIPGLGYFADGGCGGLADPVYQAAVEAFLYDDFKPSETRIINLGTGYYSDPPGPPAVAGAPIPEPPGSLLDGIEWVTNTLVGATKTFAEQAVERHWPGVLSIFNPALPSNINEADVAAIPVLLKVGQAQADAMDWTKI
jgi:hypothetical protein